jgi:hypothetical protein
MLHLTDTIILNAIGVNGTKRDTVAARFNGFGQPIDEAGQVVSGEPLPLPTSGQVKPSVDVEAVKALLEAGDFSGAQALLQAAHQAASESAGEGGDDVDVLVRATTEYLKARGWDTEDGEHFVFDPDEMVVTFLGEEPKRIIAITQRAVFGA